MLGRRTPKGSAEAALKKALAAAEAAGDPGAAEAALRRYLAERPEAAWAWFDVGLQSKRRRDWARSAEDNRRALALVKTTKDDPAAWNLGIASTALGDWSEAARAWNAYGLDVPGLATSASPLQMRLGTAPVRLNPEPRHFGETQLLIDGELCSTEVVWCQRLCPTRARILNVPTLNAGHRFGDVVLHDGEPVGDRMSGGRTYSVFNELQVLERSSMPLFEVVVSAEDAASFELLAGSFHDHELGAEDWGTMSMLCRSCSEGSPAGHDHALIEDPVTTRSFALAAPRDQAMELLGAWATEGRAFTGLQQLL